MQAPKPPLNKVPDSRGVWMSYNVWKMSPSTLGGLLGQAQLYGMTYHSTLANIWERSQPEYFHECLKFHGYKDIGGNPGTISNMLMWRLNQRPGATTRTEQAKNQLKQLIDNAINAPNSAERRKAIATAGALAELSLLTLYEQANEEKRKKLVDLFKNEIRRLVYTQSGTIGEDDDIKYFFSENGPFDQMLGTEMVGNTDCYNSSLKRGDKHLCGHPNYWNDNENEYTATAKYGYEEEIINKHAKFTRSDKKLAAGKIDEIWHNLLWEPPAGVPWGAVSWGKLDGVMYGYAENEKERTKYYDVFEAKQRQGDSSMVYNYGKPSEQTQMYVYMMMLEKEKNELSPYWRWGYKSKWFKNKLRAEKTGAWLLQTQWTSKQQTLEYIPWDDEKIEQIKGIVSRALRDLWKIQLYRYRRDSELYHESFELQEKILESVGWKN